MTAGLAGTGTVLRSRRNSAWVVLPLSERRPKHGVRPHQTIGNGPGGGSGRRHSPRVDRGRSAERLAGAVDPGPDQGAEMRPGRLRQLRPGMRSIALIEVASPT